MAGMKIINPSDPPSKQLTTPEKEWLRETWGMTAMTTEEFDAYLDDEPDWDEEAEDLNLDVDRG